ncbi:LysR family transcriptional regulator [Modestobacter sp. SYSU DS0511]
MADFDLNLVRVFVLLYETRSVTATAEAVHVTQPTVSYSLGKLRRRFDDELFRRGRGGLEPTVVADRLYEPLRQALAGISAAVDPSSAFDPAASRARFTIALSDLGEASLLPRLVGPLQAEAPGVSLTVRPLDLVASPAELARGQLDAFVATPILSSPQLRRIPLFAEGYLAMVGSAHPRLAGGAVTVEELRAERHVLVDSATGHVGPKLALETLDLLDHVALQVSKFSVLPYLVAESDLVAIVPSHAGRAFTDHHPVRLLSLPIPLEPLEIALYARPEASRTPAQRWLVDVLHRHLAAPTPPAAVRPSGRTAGRGRRRSRPGG